MSKLRRFHGKPVSRLIVSVTVETVRSIDALIEFRYPGPKHAAEGNRSEFIRLAIIEKLANDRPKWGRPLDIL
jgi:hypothetical protein